MSFGIDYLKHYQVGRNFFQTPADLSEKIMELNCYDEEDNPRCGWNVYVQRLVINSLFPINLTRLTD